MDKWEANAQGVFGHHKSTPHLLVMGNRDQKPKPKTALALMSLHVPTHPTVAKLSSQLYESCRHILILVSSMEGGRGGRGRKGAMPPTQLEKKRKRW